MRILAGLAVAVVALAPALAMADLPCDVAEPALAVAPPISAGAVFDLTLESLMQDGISLLLLSALAVVGLPWILAGLAVAVLSVPDRFRKR